MPQSPTNTTAVTRFDDWEYEDGTMPSAELAERLGVTRHMTEPYSVGGFRYTSLTDAIAQARRMAKLERELKRPRTSIQDPELERLGAPLRPRTHRA